MFVRSHSFEARVAVVAIHEEITVPVIIVVQFELSPYQMDSSVQQLLFAFMASIYPRTWAMEATYALT